jgi:hypothetical protein
MNFVQVGLSQKAVTLERSEGSHRLIRRFFTSFRMTFLCFLDSLTIDLEKAATEPIEFQKGIGRRKCFFRRKFL